MEDEPVPITILNDPPTIDDPKSNLIYVEDGKSWTESYIPLDLESSPLL